MLLSTHRLCKEYRRGTTTCAVVNAVDFCLDAGDFISIVGRSGSGKTTFISMIAGLLAPTSGYPCFWALKRRLPTRVWNRLRN